jgi:hypothetical protein
MNAEIETEPPLSRENLDALEVVWRGQQMDHYREWTRLMTLARRSVAERNWTYMNYTVEALDQLRCSMANGDTQRFLAHEYVEEIPSDGA